jgi:hypothetical protein
MLSADSDQLATGNHAALFILVKTCCGLPTTDRCFSERETGLEPATSSLGSWHSTTELLPQLPLKFRSEPKYKEILSIVQGNCVIIGWRNQWTKAAKHRSELENTQALPGIGMRGRSVR